MSDLYKKISGLPPEKRELFELLLQEQGVDLAEIIIAPQPRNTNKFPLSYSQQRLWFLDQMEPDSPLYNIATVLRMSGNLDVSALEHSLNDLIGRHEVLRTVFGEENGQPLQIIMPEQKLDIPVTDLTGLDKNRIEDRIRELAITESRKPFNLKTGPLLRVSLLKVAEDQFILLSTMHHIISDNWSTGLIVHEIMRLYEANLLKKPVALPELKVQYADFSHWQRKWLKGKTLENQVTYWKERLDNAPPVLEFPMDFPRPDYQTYHGDFINFLLGNETNEKIHKLARQNDVTVFMLLLAVFELALHRYSRQVDICVGTPVANRNRTETETVVGFFVNTLVLRADLSGNPSFTELLKRVKEDTLGAFAHQDLPFETLVEELHPKRNMSHSPFFQAMFVLNNAPMEELKLSGLNIELLEFENKTSKFDLVLNFTETNAGIRGKLEYNTDLFKPATMDRFIRHLRVLLDQVLAEPRAKIAEYSIITEEEKHDLFEKWNRSFKKYNSDKSIISLFDAQVQKIPDAIAIRIGDEQYAYQALFDHSCKISAFLLKNGLKRGEIVGICLERSFQFLSALIGVMRAGGVYLPLDPGYPQERLNFMLDDSGAKILITREKFAGIFPNPSLIKVMADRDWDDIRSKTDQPIYPISELHDTAYLIYTSGSTGNPKGVLVEHGPFANHCLDMANYYELDKSDNVLQFAALNFDASLEQIFPPLIAGATLVMRDEELWTPSEFHSKIHKYDLTVINPPTAYWAQLVDEWSRNPENIPGKFPRLVIAGGDVFHIDTLQKWQALGLNDTRLINAYGPTEAVITACTFDIPVDFGTSEKKLRIPIGHPRGNRECYILDSNLKPTPVGVIGELYIGGNALANGYLNRPELTSAVFISNPFSDDSNARLYKTGDLAKFNTNGTIEFLGRTDQQVKVRGFRIELGEIEHALKQHPMIIDSIVTIHQPPNNEQKDIIGYFVSKEGANPSVNELRTFLKSLLPDHMIPNIFMSLAKIPVDPSGKINRRALPQPDQFRPDLSEEFVAPRTNTEIKLAGIVLDVLKIDKVGVHDNFFDLGGHSMMATQVVSRIREEFGVELSLRSMFVNPSIAGFAKTITEIQAETQDEASLAGMLDELEGLSEEEVKKLLDED